MSLRTLVIALAAFAGVALGAPGAALALNPCITLSPYPIVVTQPVDPFALGGGMIQINNVPIVATPNPTPPQGTVSEADFIFWQPAGDTAAYTITDGGGSVLYPNGTAATFNNAQHQVETKFNSSTAPITFHLNLTIPYSSVTTGQNSITFPMAYYCKINSSGPRADFSGNDSTGIQLQFNVQSALQASFVGTALDFGEIGNVTTAQAAGHTVSGQLRIASSGPYAVSVTTDNGYRMTYPGGNVGVAAQKIDYQLNFLGQTASNGSPAFATRTCQAAGISGTNLAVSATLQEGGQGKTPSPTYRDNIQVTFTPLAIPPATAPQVCA
jgi:hypothetical protein